MFVLISSENVIFYVHNHYLTHNYQQKSGLTADNCENSVKKLQPTSNTSLISISDQTKMRQMFIACVENYDILVEECIFNTQKSEEEKIALAAGHSEQSLKKLQLVFILSISIAQRIKISSMFVMVSAENVIFYL